MTGDESERERAELVERAQKSPETVAVDDAVKLLSTHDVDDSGEVVAAVAAVIKAHPDDTDDVVSSLQSFLMDEDASIRSAAATTVGYVGSERPSLVAATVPTLVERLDDPEPLPRINATQALSELASHRPATVATRMPTVRSLLESDFPNVRIHSARCIAEVASESPEEVTLIFSDLVTRAMDSSVTAERSPSSPDGVSRDDQTQASPVIDHSRRAREKEVQVQTLVATAISAVARQRPEVVSYDERYTAALKADVPPAVERAAVDALGAVAQTTSERVRQAIEPLAGVLIGDYSLVIQGNAALALARLADDHFYAVTAAVDPATPTLRSLLKADDPHTRGGAAGLLTYLCERYPKAVTPAAPTLRSLLSDDYAFVRARAAFALGFVGETNSLDALAEVEGDDPSPEARAAATEAIRRIRERGTDEHSG